jgi:predicted DNA-binding transcriptional regulator YafY
MEVPAEMGPAGQFPYFQRVAAVFGQCAVGCGAAPIWRLQVVKQSRISRLMQILTTLQAGESYTIQDLSRIFAASRRTIFRDLKELQSVGVPCRYDAGRGCYTISPEYFLPSANLDTQEALGLLLLAHTVSNQMQLPFRKSALIAALKIEHTLPEKTRQYCSEALRNIFAGTDGQAAIRQNLWFDKVFAQLFEAIAKKRKVDVCYDSPFEGKIINLELCPYHLLYRNRTWHVLGWSGLHESIRTFELTRIKELTVTKKSFLHSENFDVSDYLGRAWSVIPEGRIYDVRLRFLPAIAKNVAEVKWHSTQHVVLDGDGSATVEFRVDGLSEITWWVLSYGDQVQVLAPKALRTRVLDIAKNMVRLNQNV